MIETKQIGEEIFERINCYGLGRWFETYARDLRRPLLKTDVAPGVRQITPRAAGITMTLYALSGARPSEKLPMDQIVLERANLEPPAVFPLGLDGAAETPVSARAKLSSDVVGGTRNELAAGDTRFSFFMPAARVVEITFNANLVGFERIVLARLGTPLDWRKPDHDGAKGDN